MSLPELCIRRPVMTTLLMLSFVVFGAFAYKLLPVAALPRVDFPTIRVQADLAGASPETMAASVAAPLERQFATIPSITSMTSTSGRGSTGIVMQFDFDRNIDGAALDVAAAISAVLKRLPPAMTEAPNFRKVNPADTPILFLTLASDTLPLSTVNDYAEQVFAQQISQLPGVAQVAIFGQQKYAVRVNADPDKAAARGLTLNDVGNAIAAANSNAPVGSLQGLNQNVTLEATGQMTRAENFRQIVIAFRNGSPVRLDEIADVQDSVANDQIAAWFGDKRSINLAIFRQSDANTVEVVDQVKARFAAYSAQLPPSVKASLVIDRSISIRQSIEDVQFTLVLSIALVILVIFLFLKSLSATLIPALALPVSLVGTFAFMYIFGYSIDNISLLALTLSVGFVVDDAIVMLENIVRHVEEGMQPFEAALKGASEIGFTILSITLSLVAVFIPVLLMAGVLGRVFREFAVVISVAILVSGFVSLTLTPMLCARLLKPIDHNKRPGLFSRIVDGVIDGVTGFYRVTLDWVLRIRLIMLFVTFATVYYSATAFIAIPKGLFPIEDTGLLVASIEAAADTSIESMAVRAKQVADIVGKDKDVDYYTTNVGAGGTANQGQMFIVLKPREERDGFQAVAARLRKATAGVTGITAVFNGIQNFNLTGGRPSRALYQYTMQSPDLNALYPKSAEMMAEMLKIPGLRDVNSDLQIKNPTASVEIDRDKAAAFNITSDQVRSALNNAFGSRKISSIFTQAADYDVILQASKGFQNDPSALGRIYMRAQTSGGAAAGASAGAATNISSAPIVPLDQVATIKRGVGPLSVNRQSQQPAVTLSFNLAPEVSIGTATDAIRAVERKVNLPASISTNFSGTAQLFQDSQKGQLLLLLAAVLCIYILLGVLYESFIHPITILSGLPSAGLGALLALNLYSMELSVIAIIGILLLVGIVKKNAIMMVDFALERRNEGADALSAIRDAAIIRFRPIMMTTLCALLGTLPIAMGTGAGSELRQPLGIAIVGGLCVSQILTLYITPVIYFYLDKVDSFVSGRRQLEARRRSVPAGDVLPAGHGGPVALPQAAE